MVHASSVLPSATEKSSQISSRRGKEQIRLKMSETPPPSQRPRKRNTTTRWKERSHGRVPELASRGTTERLIPRVRVWQAGELEGSGKVFVHNPTVLSHGKSTRAKRCLWAGETHDFETREHDWSVDRSLCRWPTMRSRISSGGEDNIGMLRRRLHFSLQKRAQLKRGFLRTLNKRGVYTNLV